MKLYSNRQRHWLAALELRVYVPRAHRAASSSTPQRRVLYLPAEQYGSEQGSKLLRHLRQVLGGIEVCSEVPTGARVIALGTPHPAAELELPSLAQLRADPELKAKTWQLLSQLGAVGGP